MTLQNIKSTLVSRVRTLVTRTVTEQVYDSLLLQGRMASWQVRAKQSIHSLQDVEFKVFSQWGQDGIIDWLIERAAIPPHLQTFIEFGVYDYLESNTHFLLENRNWRGLIMDGDPVLLEFIRKDHRHHRYDLTTKSTFITRENINQLITEAGFSGEIGLLNIDVDGNDYWIWEAIEAVQPIIFVSEFNAFFGDLHAVTVPYDPTFVCGHTHPERLYFGASVAALSSLSAQKGYRFLGTNTAGNDVFFMREDYAKRLDGALLNVVTWPTRARIPIEESGQTKWIAGLNGSKRISNLPLINVATGKTVTLNQLGSSHSDNWAKQIAGALHLADLDGSPSSR
jgi:hypothetical protein